MIHKIKFTIELETNILSQKDYLELQKPFMSKIIESEIQQMSFEELNNILKLDERKYQATGIEFPEMRKDNDSTIGETSINIKG